MDTPFTRICALQVKAAHFWWPLQSLRAAFGVDYYLCRFKVISFFLCFSFWNFSICVVALCVLCTVLIFNWISWFDVMMLFCLFTVVRIVSL